MREIDSTRCWIMVHRVRIAASVLPGNFVYPQGLLVEFAQLSYISYTVDNLSRGGSRLSYHWGRSSLGARSRVSSYR
jgi:hypothetical protein